MRSVEDLRKAIEARIAAKSAEYDDYRRHLGFRVREEDLHGIWDCGANMAEVSNYIDALTWVLSLMATRAGFEPASPG